MEKQDFNCGLHFQCFLNCQFVQIMHPLQQTRPLSSLYVARMMKAARLSQANQRGITLRTCSSKPKGRFSLFVLDRAVKTTVSECFHATSPQVVGVLTHDSANIRLSEEPPYDFTAVSRGEMFVSTFFQAIPNMRSGYLCNDSCHGHVDFYFVLCVEWKGVVTHRIGIGRVLKQFWDTNPTLEKIDVTLGQWSERTRSLKPRLNITIQTFTPPGMKLPPFRWLYLGLSSIHIQISEYLDQYRLSQLPRHVLLIKFPIPT